MSGGPPDNAPPDDSRSDKTRSDEVPSDEVPFDEIRSNRPRVFVAHPIPEAGLARLRASFDVTVHPGMKPMRRPELARRMAGCEAMIAMLTDRIDADLLAEARDLKVVANYAVGYDNIDVEAATRLGIRVTHTPGALTKATAEIAFALLITLTRRILTADQFVRAGRFTGWDPMLLRGDELAGRTLGIIGMGRIGREMARKCRAFDMRIIYRNRRRLDPEIEAPLQARHVALATLLAEADVISIHAPSTPETRRLIDADALALMKPGAYLINTARGDIINEMELVAALKTGRLKGAGLDVYEYEPRIHPDLAAMPNVVLLPHIGSATCEARDRMAIMAAENAAAALAGRRPPNLVPEQADAF